MISKNEKESIFLRELYHSYNHSKIDEDEAFRRSNIYEGMTTNELRRQYREIKKRPFFRKVVDYLNNHKTVEDVRCSDDFFVFVAELLRGYFSHICATGERITIKDFINFITNTKGNKVLIQRVKNHHLMNEFLENMLAYIENEK